MKLEYLTSQRRTNPSIDGSICAVLKSYDPLFSNMLLFLPIGAGSGSRVMMRVVFIVT